MGVVDVRRNRIRFFTGGSCLSKGCIMLMIIRRFVNTRDRYRYSVVLCEKNRKKTLPGSDL